MFEDLNKKFSVDIVEYFSKFTANPWNIFTLLLDIAIVLILIIAFVRVAQESRVWQLFKGIVLLVVITILSGILNLKILNFILSSFMTYGVIALLVIFQPELRRALEQLGSSTFSKFLGLDRNLRDKTKEDVYKVCIAVKELSKTKTGALIIFERDIKLQDIMETGVEMDTIISPQILVNIFVPKTPLHDGAVIIANNKIASSACILPLSDDKYIAKELGTRHRAAMGISKESDAIAVVVSEETGKVSIAKDGTLIADVKEDALKRILIKNLVVARFGPEDKTNRLGRLQGKFMSRKEKQAIEKSNQIKKEK